MISPPRAVAPRVNPMTTASTTIDSSSAATNFIASTRPRRGDRVNVVRAVRWVHSDVIANSPINGIVIPSTGVN